VIPFSVIPSKTTFSAILNNVADSASYCCTPVDTMKGLPLVFATNTADVLLFNVILTSFIILYGMP
jgi:hypothetical protein